MHGSEERRATTCGLNRALLQKIKRKSKVRVVLLALERKSAIDWYIWITKAVFTNMNYYHCKIIIKNKRVLAVYLSPLSPPQSLLLFTINLHNFTFSLAVHGSEERRATTCGLNRALLQKIKRKSKVRVVLLALERKSAIDWYIWITKAVFTNMNYYHCKIIIMQTVHGFYLNLS